jgi:hypothetical protein
MPVDFEAFGVEEYEDKSSGEAKTRWTRIGVAFVNPDSITVQLNAYPVTPKIVLMKPKDKGGPPEKAKMDPFAGK